MLAAAAVATSFNLVCTGSHTSLVSPEPETSQAYQVTYRIDLAAMRYCEGECRTISNLGQIQPTYIELWRTDSDTPSGKSRSWNMVNRQTGAHDRTSVYESRSRSSIEGWHGTCQRQPFSGFPSPITKF